MSRPKGEAWALVPDGLRSHPHRFLLAVWPWVSSFTSLRFLFFISKMGMVILPTPLLMTRGEQTNQSVHSTSHGAWHVAGAMCLVMPSPQIPPP